MSDSKSPPIRLGNVPEDVSKYILEVQGCEKVKCNCTRSKEYIVYKIIREHKEKISKNKQA